jgi:hypothetical protein
MSVNYSCLTGRPEDVVTNLLQRVSAFTRAYDIKNFEIGISNNPDRRWQEAYKFAYDDMIVLYQSSSINSVSKLEYALVDHYTDWCDNVIAGGGGNIGTPPYYLYLVRKKKY